MRLQVSARAAKPGTIDVDQPSIYWDPRLHLAMLQVLDEWRQFRQHMIRSSSDASFAQDAGSESGSKSSGKTNGWTISLKGKTTICAALSPQHTVQLQAGTQEGLFSINLNLENP